MTQPAPLIETDPGPAEAEPARTHLHLAPEAPTEGGSRQAEDEPVYATDTAADMNRLAAWAHETFRPPQVWSQRPLSACEVVTDARTRQLPGHWPVLRRGYGYCAAGLTVAAVALIWIVQSPARLATAALLVVAVVLPLPLVF